MKKDGGNNSLWSYTKDRKWRPLHSAGEFDGYKKEGAHFLSVKYADGNVTISKLLDDDMSADVLKLNKVVENTSHKVGYYFWQGDNNIFYLMRENNASSQSVWHYTKDRKWQPIHNTKSFDGFPEAVNTLKSVVLDKNKSTLSIGGVDTKSIEYSIKLKSSSLDKNNHYNSDFFNSSPNLSWSISDNLKNTVKNFIIVMRNTKTNDLIWSYNASSKERNISRSVKGDTNAIPSSSFCSKNYSNKPTKEKIINVSIAIYAIKDTTILNDIKCPQEAEKSNIASSKIEATLDVSVLTNTIEKFYESEKNDGSIKNRLVLEFANNKFAKVNKELLKIENLPDGLTSSYDIDGKEMYINLEGKAKNNEGIKNIKIILDGKIWSEEVGEQIINTSIVFLDNARSIADIENEPYYRYSWHQKPMEDMGGFKVLRESHMNIEKAWEITRGKGVIVAVIDTNFEIYHDDLSENWLSSFNAYTKGDDVSPTGSGTSHGTAVAGIVGAPVNGIGIVGSAPEAKMLFINFKLSGGSISDLIRAFTYAQENGAKVINCSWGGTFVTGAFKAKMQELYDAGITILFATGNKNANLDYRVREVGGAESQLPSVLAVGATDQYNERASYSNYGSDLDFVAPAGGSFLSNGRIKLTLGMVIADRTGSAGHQSIYQLGLVNDAYSFGIGTSYATPNAAGVVALMVSVNPDLTPKQIREIIISTTDKIVGGYDSTGFNIELGYGKLNAYKAVAKAKAMLKE